jgi:hypothetical protein
MVIRKSSLAELAAKDSRRAGCYRRGARVPRFSGKSHTRRAQTSLAKRYPRTFPRLAVLVQIE